MCYRFSRSLLSFVLFAGFAIAASGCSLTRDSTTNVEATANITASSSEPEAIAKATTEPSTSPATSSAESEAATATPQADPGAVAYYQGVTRASSAFSISQTARTPDDWKLVANRWQQAINLLTKVPSSSASYSAAQGKIVEYNRNFQVAQAKANDAQVSSVTNQGAKRTFRARIIGRAGGTPVILVNFNAGKLYPMIVDTGASGTVITTQMAQELGVVPTGVIRAQVADGRIVEKLAGVVQSVDVAGAKAENLQISVAPPAMDIGLLGNNFFAQYNVTFEQDWVVFHER